MAKKAEKLVSYSPFFQESISEASVRKFCKEAANLVLHKDSGSIADELSGNLSPKSKLYETIEQNPDSEATYYLILRAVDRFQTDFNVIPGYYFKICFFGGSSYSF